MKQNRQQKKESITKQRQGQILDAALQVFSKRGFAHATTAEIAQTAGIAEGTIYNYYKNKRDLFISVIRNYIMSDPVVELIKKSQGLEDINLISSLVENRLNLSLREIDSFLLLMSELHRDQELRRQFMEEVTGPIVIELEKYIGSITSSGRARPLNIAVVTRALIGMMIGLLIINKVEGEQGPLNQLPRDEVVAEVTALMMKGFQSESDKA
jgi:AcrR family transcriptional regulator